MHEADEDNDPLVTEPVVHRIVSAADSAQAVAPGPCSVFDLARAPVKTSSKWSGFSKTAVKVDRTDGRIVCVRVLPQDTAEWREREAARRARQTPPRPKKQARTMGAKLSGLLGRP